VCYVYYIVLDEHRHTRIHSMSTQEACKAAGKGGEWCDMLDEILSCLLRFINLKSFRTIGVDTIISGSLLGRRRRRLSFTIEKVIGI